MAEVEITGIFQDIIQNNLRYCAICLRTERERKLVEPISYKKCLIMLPVEAPENDSLAVCFLCENEARRAWQLFNACSFAATINCWFVAMTTKLRYIDDMPMDLKRVTKNMKFEECSFSSFWRMLRSRTELLQTEVLRVTTDGSQQDSDSETAEPSAAAPPPEPQSHLIPDMLGNPDLEHVVIIDDEDDSQTNTATNTRAQTDIRPLPNLVSVATLLSKPTLENVAILPDQRLLMGRDAALPGSFVLYPAQPCPDGSWYIPSLNAKLSNGAFVRSLPLPEIDRNFNRQYENVKFLEINGRNYEMKVADVDNNYFKKAKTEAIKPVGSVPLQIESCKSRIEFRSNTKKPDSDVNTKPAKTDAKEENKNENSKKPKVALSKQPIMNDRVDWEEKIPMDVISFVDATDPHADQFLGPPDSTTGLYSKNPKKSRYKEDDVVVIDLC